MQPKECLLDAAALNEPHNLMRKHVKYRHHHRGLHITTLQKKQKRYSVIAVMLYAQLRWRKKTPICVVGAKFGVIISSGGKTMHLFHYCNKQSPRHDEVSTLLGLVAKNEEVLLAKWRIL